MLYAEVLPTSSIKLCYARFMNKKLFTDILELSVPERLQLVQDIWDSIAEVPESLQLTDEQKIEIERRRAEYLADPSILVSWDEVKARIGL